MNVSFRVALIVGVLLYLGLIFYLLKKGRMSIRYSIIWLFSGAALLIFALFPYVVLVLRDIFQVEVASNLIFMAVIAFMLLILLSLSSAVSQLSERCKRLTQTQALLERRLRELESGCGAACSNTGETQSGTKPRCE